MHIHKMTLTRGPFEKMSRGQKFIESRLYDEKRRQINIGDYIEFYSSDNPLKKIFTRVQALYRYSLNYEMCFSVIARSPVPVDDEDILSQVL